jgi:hypothetical protein
MISFLLRIRFWGESCLEGAIIFVYYPIPSPLAIKRILGVFRPSLEQWHSWHGHPPYLVVTQVLNNYHLPMVEASNKQSVCDVCQQAKSHQLRFSTSSHKYQFPLELVYSDVWDAASTSASGYKYYVSFIDDYSKFTWIYFVKIQASSVSIILRISENCWEILF